MGKILILCDENRQFIEQIITENGIHAESISEVPANTTMEEIQDAIVENRSKIVEEDYADAFTELA